MPDEVHNLLKPSTRLSKALELHPDVLEYIVSLQPHEFERLRHPIMHKLIPPRISLERVAAIAKIPVRALLEQLGKLTGANVEIVGEITLPQSSKIRPAWLENIDPNSCLSVNLLPLDERLEADPMPPVMLEVKKLRSGQVLVVQHKWEPQPFYDVWSKMPGLEWFSEQVRDDEWRIWLHKD